MQSVREFLRMQKLDKRRFRQKAMRRPCERGEGFPLQRLYDRTNSLLKSEFVHISPYSARALTVLYACKSVYNSALYGLRFVFIAL